MKWKAPIVKQKCCECGSTHRTLIKWLDHPRDGFVCLRCAHEKDYFFYVPSTREHMK